MADGNLAVMADMAEVQHRRAYMADGTCLLMARRVPRAPLPPWPTLIWGKEDACRPPLVPEIACPSMFFLLHFSQAVSVADSPWLTHLERYL